MISTITSSITRFGTILKWLLLVLIAACSSEKKVDQEKGSTKNKVLVLGAIHGNHLKSELYGLDELSSLVKAIHPDLILTEIPPDRFPTAMREFQEKDTITESRVSRFPEYVNVIFPLTKEMEFKIIPTAGWTEEMAEARRTKLRTISQDTARAKEWKQYMKAQHDSDSALMTQGKSDDPYFIHTQRYDDAVEIWASTYNELFNEELGLGGWDNINKAHYANIEKALEEYKNQGKTVLITYGAGHKGWFLRELRKRDDIELLDMKPFLDKALNAKDDI
ncbi:MAG: hypothetical protein AAFX87_26895 [Bacteroidota bacterium]